GLRHDWPGPRRPGGGDWACRPAGRLIPIQTSWGERHLLTPPRPLNRGDRSWAIWFGDLKEPLGWATLSYAAESRTSVGPRGGDDDRSRGGRAAHRPDARVNRGSHRRARQH